MRADVGGAIGGSIDVMGNGVVHGWAALADGTGHLRVSVWLGDRLIGTGIADQYRPDIDAEVGFSVRVEAAPTGDDINSGAFRVIAEGGDGASAELHIAPTFLPGEAEAALIDYIERVPFPRLMSVLARDMLRRPPVSQYDQLAPGVVPNELSPFYLPVGLLSGDGAVVVGREGHMFLMAGSNDLVGQYRDGRDEAEVGAEAKGWVRLFERRAEMLAERGIPYRQTIVPEKSTVLPECFPVPIRAPTRLFARIEAELAGSSIAGSYVPLLAALRDHPHRRELYLPVDTHFAAEGIFFVLSRLLAALDLPVPPVRFDRPEICTGDLGIRFPGIPFCATYRVPDLPELESYGAGVEQVALTWGPNLNGTRMVLRNPNAPIDRKVMVFGNSYFSVGGTVHTGSYWMGRLFSEYHFHWSPDFDFAAIDAVRPDIVIGQTIERFLPRLPET